MSLIVVVLLAVCLVVGIVLVAAFLLARAGHECPRCRRRNRSEARFCARCGAPLDA
jgi:predicted amidophosphoribosyltransferase